MSRSAGSQSTRSVSSEFGHTRMSSRAFSSWSVARSTTAGTTTVDAERSGLVSGLGNASSSGGAASGAADGGMNIGTGTVSPTGWVSSPASGPSSSSR